MKSRSALGLAAGLAMAMAAAAPLAAQGIKFDGPKFNTPQIAADMAKLKITKDDLSEMYNGIEGITRWPGEKAGLHFSLGKDFDEACAKKTGAQLIESIAELHKRASTRFEFVVPDKADAIIELNDVPLLDKYWQARSKLPGAQISYKAPRNTAAVRWDMATVWNPPKHEMMAGYAYEGVYFAQNRTRPGIVAPCQAFPLTWWIVHISKPHDRPLLNFMIPRDYSFPDSQLYDIMNFTIMNSEGVKNGMKGKDLVEALKAALP